MQITPNHDLLHALGSAPSSPEPARKAAAAPAPAALEPVTPGGEALPRRPEADVPAEHRVAEHCRPGARVDILA